MSKDQARLLRFAIAYPGWHSYSSDRNTTRIVRTLVSHGLLEVNEFRQFRLRNTGDSCLLEPKS